MSAGLIPEEIINQIRERVDIADVVANYVALSRTGQNLKGLCPFHSEKSPSFTVVHPVKSSIALDVEREEMCLLS